MAGIQLWRLDAEILDAQEAGELVAAGGECLGPALAAVDDGQHLVHLQPEGLDRSIAWNDEPPVVTTSSTITTLSPG